MTTDASVVTCPTCGRKNRVPAAATGRPRCANCHNPLPWLAEADDDSFAERVEQATADGGAPHEARPHRGVMVGRGSRHRERRGGDPADARRLPGRRRAHVGPLPRRGRRRCHRGGLGAPAAMAAAPADAFAGTERSPFLRGVERLDASGSRAWSALMAGWLMSRLALAPPAIRLIEADRTAVLIRARHDGRQATIAADAVDDQEVQITTTVTNRPSRRRRLRLPTRSTAADLEAALTSRPGPDEIWERATAGALRLLEQR
jgi:hypothetical protein